MELIINNLQIIATYSVYNKEATIYSKNTNSYKITTKATDIRDYFHRNNINNTFHIESDEFKYFYSNGYLLNDFLQIVGVIGRINPYITNHLQINKFDNIQWELFINTNKLDKKFIDQLSKYAINIRVNLLSDTMFNILCQSKVTIPNDRITVESIISNYLKLQFKDISSLEILDNGKSKESTNLFTGIEEVIETSTEPDVFDLEETTRDESDYQICDRCENEYYIDDIQDDGICNDCHAEEDEYEPELGDDDENPF